METDSGMRALAEDAVRLAEEFTAPAAPGESWEVRYEADGYALYDGPDLGARIAQGLAEEDAAALAHAGTHYATLARALIEALDEREAMVADLAVVIEAAKREAATLDHEVEVCDAGFRGNARELEQRAASTRAAIERLEGRGK